MTWYKYRIFNEIKFKKRKEWEINRKERAKCASLWRLSIIFFFFWWVGCLWFDEWVLTVNWYVCEVWQWRYLKQLMSAAVAKFVIDIWARRLVVRGRLRCQRQRSPNEALAAVPLRWPALVLTSYCVRMLIRPAINGRAKIPKSPEEGKKKEIL